MAMWQPQRSKQNCLAAWPELTPEGLSVPPSPLLQGFPRDPHTQTVQTQARIWVGFHTPTQSPNWEKPQCN